MTRVVFVAVLFCFIDTVEKVMCIKESNRTVTIYRIVEECCPGYTKDKDGGCVRVSGVDIKVGTSKNPAVPAVTVEPMDPSHVETVTYDNGSAEGGSASEGGSGGYNSDDDDDGKFFLGLSHGAYAGIVCGILFVACVALLTALHYRKRKQRQKKMSTINMEQDVTQQQQMLPMQRMDTEPVPT
ncbi:hypothetical protein BaRGS_00020811 [Batillaria attramentaria]|uniref:Uncharacterized protein n=1 Tax=Batillaria attramentaria TaxID=370345 RepID=A0ABD0KLP7_9CAEN